MAGKGAVDVLGKVTLVTGPEEFLNERTVVESKAAVKAIDGEAEFSEAQGGDLSLATLGELAAPSLFSSTRCIVVRQLENLPDESIEGLLGYCKDPVEDVALILVHSGGQKGSGVLNKLRKLAPVTEHKSAAIKASEFPRFVSSEVRRHGSRVDDEAADFLVQAIGQDLRSLSAAAHQLVNDFPGESLNTEKVKRYFGGRAEAKSFAVADSAFFGRRAKAMEELRWALDGGTAPVLITSAFAGGVRGLARYVSAPRGMREADLAREVGVPPWKLRTLRDQSRAWSPTGLAEAIRAIAQADADIKGAAHDAAYTLEKLVLTVAGLRDQR
ncbi:DNA polymerase-3 subunit delta [Nocardioides daedukensis]|uniref:DNA-directed DNA polymerase n=1 Tax=Nocardioides daedukensis TaxID=634462 RepID=A0A7Y9S1M7_9ACTN|nr:DNA polymerase III subunit delta [Nocardioides daedukensis]NYG60651.1 DNA polymerase-3 subunit delta [Nocardioides daedukensis]